MLLSSLMPHLNLPMQDSKSPSSDGVHKRTPTACDRCRTKKAKCDGVVPCRKCRDNGSICTFTQRKRARDKVYPKGYTEFLEGQQKWLTLGVQELYRRILVGEGWPGEPLKCKSNGRPLTHDILTQLHVLDHEADDPQTEVESTLVTHNTASQSDVSLLSTQTEGSVVDFDAASISLPTQDAVEPQSPPPFGSLEISLGSRRNGSDYSDQVDHTSEVNSLKHDVQGIYESIDHLFTNDCLPSDSLSLIDSCYDNYDYRQSPSQMITDMMDIWPGTSWEHLGH